MTTQQDFQKIIEKYDLDKLTLECAELFDIAQKYLFRKERITKWYLKPLYLVAYKLALFLAKTKSKPFLKNSYKNNKKDTENRYPIRFKKGEISR